MAGNDWYQAKDFPVLQKACFLGTTWTLICVEDQRSRDLDL